MYWFFWQISTFYGHATCTPERPIVRKIQYFSLTNSHRLSLTVYNCRQFRSYGFVQFLVMEYLWKIHVEKEGTHCMWLPCLLGSHACICSAVHRTSEERQSRKAVVVAGHQRSICASFFISLVLAIPCRSTDCGGGRWIVCCVVNCTQLHHMLHCATFCVAFYVMHWRTFCWTSVSITKLENIFYLSYKFLCISYVDLVCYLSVVFMPHNYV